MFVLGFCAAYLWKSSSLACERVSAKLVKGVVTSELLCLQKLECVRFSKKFLWIALFLRKAATVGIRFKIRNSVSWGNEMGFSSFS